MKLTRKLVLGATLSLFCAAAYCAESEPKSVDEGYFLSWKQKGELLWEGQLSDSAGNLYDVWICPGYTAPAKYGAKHWEKGANDFMEYFEGKKYRKTWNTVSDMFETAWDDVFYEWMLKGVPRAWSKHFSAASERVEKRVFGWFFAYPIAFCQSTIDNLFRIPAGLCGTSIVSASTSVVPLWHGLNSGVAGTCEWIFPGTLTPVGAWTWNSLVTPPLVFIGQRPSPERVDGFWVVMEPHVYSEEELQSIADCFAKLSKEIRELNEEKSILSKERLEAEKKLREEFEPREAAIRERHDGRISVILEGLVPPSENGQVNARFSPANITANRSAIITMLKRSEISDNDAQNAINYYIMPKPQVYKSISPAHGKTKGGDLDPIGDSMTKMRQEK
ncbi:MAG: hypothetical protein A2X49_02950 [Lentisphaerae bacterium GWF2_52_8]|nr:MAG: hypothetical protein A2X49_02950 [Lentisphaerae bacterium GWF2_52_8]